MHERSKGMTLIEVLMSLAIVGVVMGAASSVLTFATKALPANGSTEDTRVRINQAMSLLTQEVSEATGINELTATAIDFMVADRNHNGTQERVRYEWGGNGNTGLRRTFNGSSGGDLLGEVGAFRIVPHTTTRTRIIDGPAVWSAEKLLYSYEGAPTGQVIFRGANVAAQVFLPVFEDSVVNWTVTRVEVPLIKIVSLTPLVAFEVRRVTVGDKPSLAPGPAASVDALNSNKAFPTWYSGTIGTFVSYPRASPLAILLRPDTNFFTQGAAVAISSGVAGDVTHLCEWGMTDWNVQPNAGVLCRIYGKTQDTTKETEDWTAVTGVSISLTLASGQSTGTTVRILNEPEEP